MENKIRQSNFELMRIISMIFIIIYHILLHTNFKATGTLNYLLIVVKCLTYVHVDSFILITGYFQCKSKTKMSKVISLNNAMWFWKVFFLLLTLYFVPKFSLKLDHVITGIEKIETLLPFDTNTYWFINCYLITYLISPILNKIINNSTKSEHKNIIIILTIIFSIFSVFSYERIVNVDLGRSIITFILLYFIGAYLRLYPIENSYLFKKYTDNMKKVIFFTMYLFFAFLCFSCYIISKNIEYGSLSTMISNVFENLYDNFISIFVILQTIFYFLFFKMLKFNSKFINKISKYTLGVYLVHENIYLRENIYNWVHFSKYVSLGSKLILLIIVVAIAIYIISLILEIIRCCIFKLIYNLKISKKWRKFYRNYIKSLGFNINW